jgi:hypothetical protein
VADDPLPLVERLNGGKTGVTAHHEAAVGGQVRWQRPPGCGNAGTADGSIMTTRAALGLGLEALRDGCITTLLEGGFRQALHACALGCFGLSCKSDDAHDSLGWLGTG